MKTVNISTDFLNDKMMIPAYATQGSAGFDLQANIPDDDFISIKPFHRLIIPTGIKVAIPKGYEIQIRPRSGLAFKIGFTVLNAPGTIDSDYRGEIGVIAYNADSTLSVGIGAGDKIAQGVLAAYERASWNPVWSLDETERGAGGFGSTDKSPTVRCVDCGAFLPMHFDDCDRPDNHAV
jgi:dUTP pyrophosphatase